MSISLWQQLQSAAAMVQAVRAGRSMATALDGVAAELRPGVQALSFQALRWLGRAEALRKQLARRAPPEPADALLCTALALLWRPELAPYPDFTLVDQAVEAAQRHPATRRQAPFINACLRRFLREREALVAATDADPVARWSHPRWWIERLRRDHPAQWEAILQVSQRPGPMTLRVNRLRGTVEQYLARLEAAGMPARAVGEVGVQLAQPRPVQALPGFADGLVSVQDAAAQLAAPLLLQGLDTRAPLRLLDACAAPGGKTAHLLELCPQAQVTALEVDARRAERIGQNLGRLGLQAQVLTADAGQPDAWWTGEPFDAILLDAPCTASGIGRRHPDVRWLRRESDIAQLAAIQARLLRALWPLLRTGGRLLYCTCSVFREEGDRQIETFLARNTEAVLCPSPGHLTPTGAVPNALVSDNGLGEHDGFFYALLEKRAASAGDPVRPGRAGGAPVPGGSRPERGRDADGF